MAKTVKCIQIKDTEYPDIIKLVRDAYDVWAKDEQDAGRIPKKNFYGAIKAALELYNKGEKK